MRRPTLGRPAPATLALGALAIVAVAVAVIALGDAPASTAATERTVTAHQGVVQQTVSGSGNLAPANEVDLDFGASGKVTDIDVKEGQHVSTGDVLGRIDSRSAEIGVAQAKASLESAQDTLDTAETAATTPASSNSSSGSSSSGGSQTSVAAAQAAVDSAQLTLEQAEQALADTVLRAPVPGTITAINGTVGETAGSSTSSTSSDSSSSSTGSSGPTVSAGLGGSGDTSSASDSSSSSFMTISQISRYKIEVSLSESDIGSAKVGQSATVTVNAASGEQYEARVTAVGLTPSSSSSTSAVSYPVTLTLLQSGGGLKPGMSATADIVTKQASGIVVPSQAVSGSTVTVVDADGNRETRRVTTGVAGDTSTQIVSGLKSGDSVVVRSQSAAAGAAASGTAATTQTSQRTGAAGRTFGGGAGGFGGGTFGGGGGGGFGGGARQGAP